MKNLSIDLESYSSVNLAKSGVYRYAEAPDFEILLFGYSADGAPVRVVDLTAGETLPADVRSALTDPAVTKWAFNAQFERVCLSRYLGYPTGQYLDPSSWHCTMVWAATLGLPLSLEGVGAVLELEKQKLKEGKDLIRYFCTPAKAKDGSLIRHHPADAPEKWELFKVYNLRDVETEMSIQQKLSKFPVTESEWRNYTLDQQINDRGIMLDRTLVTQAIRCDERFKQTHMEQARLVTGLDNPNSPVQLKAWLAEKGVETDSLSKAAVADMLEKYRGPRQVGRLVGDRRSSEMTELSALDGSEGYAACDDAGEVELALSLRQELAKSSVKKYTAMQTVVGSDDRARGLIQFYGANRTGRWCLTGDHEVLTDHGWCPLSEWSGGTIACWNPHGEVVSFQKAEAVSFDYDGEVYEYEDKRISQISTPDHKMWVKRRYGGEWQVDTIENMAKYQPSIPFTGRRNTDAGLEHCQLRVLVMVQADGHFTADGSIRLSFKKLRKIERCKRLLRTADISFTFRSYEQSGVSVITVNSRDVPLWLRLFREKTFGTWLFDESPDVFFDELAYWDGYRSAKNSVQYSTCNRQNADMVQAFAHLTGRCALMRKRSRSFEHANWKDAYVVDVWLTTKNCHEVKSKPAILHFVGKVYCAVTPTGYFLVRRNGRVWVTGNSGRLIQVQNLPQNHLPDLDTARALVRSGNTDAVEMLYDSVPLVLSELIRTAFVPKPGYRFYVADFSAIEARVIAWLAGETWRMDLFRAGGDIYCQSASQMFGVPVEKHGVNGHLRQKGKIAELACIAEGQLVLTDVGLVPIEKVTPKMKLWDGESWVSHGGVIYKGRKGVITYEGLSATPDHLVWVEGQSWPIQFGAAAACGAHLVQTGNGEQPIRLGGDNQPGETVEQGHEPQRITVEKPKTAGQAVVRSSPVYDIRDAGVHHRFTVSGHLVHNCGYGGSVGALKAMGALNYGLQEEELKPLVDAWRLSNPHITKFWWDVDKAASTCVRERTATETHGIRFNYQSGMMFVVLPSGRRLVYVKPKMGMNRFGNESVTYEGVGEQKKWLRLESYGPKFVENIVQATARDILAEAMLRLNAAGYRIVMHVHDEVVIEAPLDTSLENICSVMGQTPAWTSGLLLRADGYACDFYKKD